MRTLTFQGTLTALSSIAHDGKRAGTTHVFRRETLVSPEGKHVSSIPVVSANLIRKKLRGFAAHAIQDALGAERLPAHVVHALHSGGSMAESRDAPREVLTGEKQAQLRDLLPFFGVFGGNAGGRVLSGQLVVDKALPVSQQTAHLADDYSVDLDGYAPPAVHTLVQRESYSQFADIEGQALQPQIAVDGTDRSLPKGAGTMLWHQETLVAGCRLWHRVMLTNATPIEVSFFRDVFRRWQASSPRIGGQVARGHGRVRPHYEETVTDVWGESAELEPADWRAYLHEHRDAALDALSWL